MTKRLYELTRSWNVVEVYEIDMPDDPDGLITAYEELCENAALLHAYRDDPREEALEELRCALALEWVHGPNARLAGVDVDWADADLSVVERHAERFGLTHPRVWRAIQRALFMLDAIDPLEALCAVTSSTRNVEEHADGSGI